jgi:hypothetical protein
MSSLDIAQAPEVAAGSSTPCSRSLAPVSGVFPVGGFLAPTGDWALGRSSFRHITRAHRLLAPYVWARQTASMACYCPLSLSSPGRPLGPGISPPIPPHSVGDMSERLVAQKKSTGARRTRHPRPVRPTGSCAERPPGSPWRTCRAGRRTRPGPVAFGRSTLNRLARTTASFTFLGRGRVATSRSARATSSW